MTSLGCCSIKECVKSQSFCSSSFPRRGVLEPFSHSAVRLMAADLCSIAGKQQSCSVKDVLVSMKKSYSPSGDELCWTVAVMLFRGSVVQLNGGE